MHIDGSHGYTKSVCIGYTACARPAHTGNEEKQKAIFYLHRLKDNVEFKTEFDIAWEDDLGKIVVCSPVHTYTLWLLAAKL